MPAFRTTSFLRDTAILFLGVLSATWVLDSIEVESNTTLVLVALVLALLNMVLKPLLILFALPFVIFTFGLGVLLINAVLLYLAGQLVAGFTVPTFGTAFLGALIISAISIVVNMFLSPRPNVRFQWSVNGRAAGRPRRPLQKDDVIDV